MIVVPDGLIKEMEETILNYQKEIEAIKSAFNTRSRTIEIQLEDNVRLNQEIISIEKEIDSLRELLLKALEQSDSYYNKLNETLNKLDEAVKVIEFYGNERNWEGREIDGDDWHDFYEDGNGIGGKTAREFLKRMRNEINT